MSQPLIYIDSGKVRELEISIALQKIYYQPSGYQRTAKNLLEASKQAGFDFTLSEINEWLERQALYQIHKPRPKYIPYASFNKITVPMEVIQADLCYMPHDIVGNKIYKYALNCVDIASRTKWTYPLTDRDSASVAIGFEKLFNSKYCPLIWPKTLMVDKGSEFKKDVIKLKHKYNFKIWLAKSKESMGITERYNLTLQKWAFYIQDAVEMLLPPTERHRAWVKDLPIFLKKLDNTKTILIGMSPAQARKKKHVYAKASSKYIRPIGHNESLLSSNVEVRYLLKPGELEGGRKRGTDMNWSPETYTIKSILVQKNQPVLYKLYNGPDCTFVRERLQIVHPDTELPPMRILKH